MLGFFYFCVLYAKCFFRRYELNCYFRLPQWIWKNGNFILAQTKTCLSVLVKGPKALFGPLAGEIQWIHACPCICAPVCPSGCASVTNFSWNLFVSFSKILHGKKNLKTEKSDRSRFSGKVLVCPKSTEKTQNGVLWLFITFCWK